MTWPLWEPYYDDGTVTILHGDIEDLDTSDTSGGPAACVVTSPPYNVGLAYDHDPTVDALGWDAYRDLTTVTVDAIRWALVPGGRAWVNTAVSVPMAPRVSGGRKRRVLLGAWWATAMGAGGLELESQDTWKEGTSDAWPYIRARLMRHMGAIQLRDVDQLVLKRLRRDLAKDYAPNTVKLTMAYAGMILRAAHTSGRIARDPTAGLREKKRRADEKDDRVRPEDVPTRAEALAILNGTPGSFRAGVALGLAGLRVGEVLG